MAPTAAAALFALLLSPIVLAAPAEGNDLKQIGTQDSYQDATQPIEARVANLLGQMTQAEKLGQVSQGYLDPGNEKENASALRRGELGSLLPGGGAVGDAALRNRLQRAALESRLGIPFIMGFDSIHGFRTIFPIPLAMASAWEPELFERAQAVSAFESSAGGVDWAFAPMVDLARDPRWGRIAEGFGEDPYLGSLDTAASVRGFQGPKNDADPRRVAACLKHFVAYGATEGGRDYNTTDLSEYQLRNAYLPQYRAGVDAGAMTLMSAFNCLNGIPASCNHHTLTDILRGEWGFKGFVVSDWTAITELKNHGVADSDADCARLGITAGVDMEMLSTTYRKTLAQQVDEGTVTQAVIDEAVRRILRIKFQRGLFDHPLTDESWQKDAYLRPESLQLARAAAVKSCVLLKNDKGILPLNQPGVKIALIGPLADDPGEMLGSWRGHGRKEDAVTLAKGLAAKVPAAAGMTVTRGCDLTRGKRTLTRTDGTIVEDATSTAAKSDDADFAAAVQAALAADVVVMALGEPAGWSGENATRTELGLTGRQEELFAAVAATGRPVIVVLFNGRPLVLGQIREKATAILEAWQPGVQGGNAVADILFGDASPSGRLTVSFPRAVGQVPLYYNRLSTGRPEFQDYRDCASAPSYPFGFGLSYTTIAYGETKVGAGQLKTNGTVTVTAMVTNTGTKVGDEVVQLYLHARAASRARPIRELKGFQKVRLNPGEAQAVSFSLPAKDFGFFDEAGRWLVEPGRYDLWIAPNAEAGKPVTLELTR
jgi:beta-glucosidase